MTCIVIGSLWYLVLTGPAPIVRGDTAGYKAAFLCEAAKAREVGFTFNPTSASR